MTTQLTFGNMQQVAQKIFGMEIHRSGSSFRLLKDGVWLGENQGTLFSLKDIRALFQQWFDHPEAPSLVSEEFRRSIAA